MKRVLIIGSSGSGKSTLARQLGTALDLPVIHLDKRFWHPGWVGTPQDVWANKIAEMTKGEAWIIDGNYRNTLDIRLRAADTVIFLDLPRIVCAWRATKRRFQYLHKQRPDIAEGCRENLLDPSFPSFLRWVWNYPNRARPNVLQKMKRLPDNKRFIWLRSKAEVYHFMERPLHWSTYTAPANNSYEYIARFDG